MPGCREGEELECTRILSGRGLECRWAGSFPSPPCGIRAGITRKGRQRTNLRQTCPRQYYMSDDTAFKRPIVYADTRINTSQAGCRVSVSYRDGPSDGTHALIPADEDSQVASTDCTIDKSSMAALGSPLASPPGDGVTSLGFVPGSDDLLVSSSWDGVRGGLGGSMHS